MTQPPALTDDQRRKLRKLEPALRAAVRMGDYEGAKRITLDIQRLLRPTGHETRLMQAKNWLFEAALEAGQIKTAIRGLSAIRDKVSPATRVHLEASALLAIGYLRQGDLVRAEPMIASVLQNTDSISSEKRRRQFHLRIVRRFEEEAALAALAGTSLEPLNIHLVQEEAGRLVQSKTEDEIYANVGREIPPEVIRTLQRVHEFARKQLPAAEVRFLPPARTITEKAAIGRTVTEATKRVVWRSLCDPTDEVYQAWCTNGVMGLLDKKVLVTALVTMLSGMKVGAFTLVASLAALILRMGLNVFCEVSRPNGVMIETGRNADTKATV